MAARSLIAIANEKGLTKINMKESLIDESAGWYGPVRWGLWCPRRAWLTLWLACPVLCATGRVLAALGIYFQLFISYGAPPLPFSLVLWPLRWEDHPLAVPRVPEGDCGARSGEACLCWLGIFFFVLTSAFSLCCQVFSSGSSSILCCMAPRRL